MDYVAAREFNTTNRRFRVGDPVMETDLEGSALDFETMRNRRWIVSDESKTGKKAVRAGDKAAAAEEEAEVAAAQDDLRREWEAAAGTGVAPEGQWAISLPDDELFGRILSEDGNSVRVQVPGEQGVRFYLPDDLDRTTRTATGKPGIDQIPRRRR